MSERGVLWVGATLIVVSILIGSIVAINYFSQRAGSPGEDELPETGDGSPEATVIFILAENVTFKCEVADTEAERAAGLMNRESLGNDSGMLFIFEEPQNLTFWMKNTLIPLDIIFIDKDGIVLNVEEADVEPGVPDNSLTRHKSDGPAKWALEIKQGLSEHYGIAAGTQVVIDLNHD